LKGLAAAGQLGRTKKEIRRCLKRYIAREICSCLLNSGPASVGGHRRWEDQLNAAMWDSTRAGCGSVDRLGAWPGRRWRDRSAWFEQAHGAPAALWRRCPGRANSASGRTVRDRACPAARRIREPCGCSRPPSRPARLWAWWLRRHAVDLLPACDVGGGLTGRLRECAW